jgi:hypothetical protein
MEAAAEGAKSAPFGTLQGKGQHTHHLLHQLNGLATHTTDGWTRFGALTGEEENEDQREPSNSLG